MPDPEDTKGNITTKTRVFTGSSCWWLILTGYNYWYWLQDGWIVSLVAVVLAAQLFLRA